MIKDNNVMITETHVSELILPSPPPVREEGKKEFSAISKQEKSGLLNYLHHLKKTKLKTFVSQVMLFRAISLCISISLVILAFEWKSYDDGNLVNFGGLEAEFEEIMDVPVTEQPPPPPPQAQVINITEVPDVVEIENEINMDLDVEVTEESVIEAVIYDELEVVEEEAEEIFQFVEQSPTPVGGLTAFYEYISSNMQYPGKARLSGIEGKVYVQFVIAKDGSITDIEVLKGIGFGCDDEAIRVLSTAPKWNPGKQRGQPVKVRMTVPIIFKLLDQ